MITIMSLTYIACVVVAFKVIKIKVSPTSVAVAVVAGFFLLGGILIVWKQSAPMTEQMVLRRHVFVPCCADFATFFSGPEHPGVYFAKALVNSRQFPVNGPTHIQHRLLEDFG